MFSINVRSCAGEIVSHTDGARGRKGEKARERKGEKARGRGSEKARHASHAETVFQ